MYVCPTPHSAVAELNVRFVDEILFREMHRFLSLSLSLCLTRF